MVSEFAERSHNAEELVLCHAPLILVQTICKHKENSDLSKLGYLTLGKLFSTTLLLMNGMEEILSYGIETSNSGCIANSLSFFIKLLQYDETAMLVVDHCIPFLFEIIERKNITNIVALLMTDIFDRLTKSNDNILFAFLEYENCSRHLLLFIQLLLFFPSSKIQNIS
ncbi:hypothetical protein RFI_18214 [Reticulomyxa filosa]|uniref:Uncharacterized protein n=1 Tax=Reticulomyxa filosa TaxID=46433 RepID=X6MZE7_RETFI|nr:hypothetical protein RFI_18214 [Reticulomyxa filosa]|eukprot:ETO19023.1 hypothetical protein RFI_18214 [Reticulomyxa filosa]